jgi:tetratricopeptide (TPR) repeat protein
MITALSTTIDPTGKATKWSAEAEQARAQGNVREASELHKKAGELLESTIAGTANHTDRNVMRFLAATQFYLGGHYRNAAKLIGRINADRLPDQIREQYLRFEHDVHERAKPGYVQAIFDRISLHRSKGEYKQILDLLKDHYYFAEDWRLAFFQGQCCAHLGDFKAAAIFYSDAVRHSADPLLVLTVAVWPLSLALEGRIDDACNCVEYLRTHVPHPLMTFSASVVLEKKASATTHESERKTLYEEQIRLLREAETAFKLLPADAQQVKLHREFAVMALVAAATAHRNLGGPASEEAAINHAIEFAPDDPLGWVIRGHLKYPSPQSVVDFRKAIELGERDYIPFAYLAQDAIRGHDITAAQEFVSRALERQPPQGVRSHLLHYLDVINRSIKKGGAVVASSRLAVQTEVSGHANGEFDLGIEDPLVRKEKSLTENQFAWTG